MLFRFLSCDNNSEIIALMYNCGRSELRLIHSILDHFYKRLH